MSVVIRLTRGGSKKRPFYRIVAADKRCPRDGNFLEKLGTYDPMLPKDAENRVRLDEARIRHWLGNGALPSDRVARFLSKAGIIEPRPVRNNPKKAAPKARAQERAKEAAEKAQAEA